MVKSTRLIIKEPTSHFNNHLMQSASDAAGKPTHHLMTLSGTVTFALQVKLVTGEIDIYNISVHLNLVTIKIPLIFTRVS